MQTQNNAAMLSARGTIVISSMIVIVLMCFTQPSFAASAVCRDAIECSGQGYCLQNNTCLCNPGVGGSTCNRCLNHHYSYPTCTYCDQTLTCNGNGGCMADGTCFCNSAFNGTLCDRCAIGFYGYPNCVGCSKQLTCSGQGACTPIGTCECYNGFTGSSCNKCSPNRTLPDCLCDYPLAGRDCDRCTTNHYNYPLCVECIAEVTCSGQGSCSKNGTCTCKNNIIGAHCDTCSPGHYNYPLCVECDQNKTCNGRGTCNSTGGCVCKDWTGQHCEIQPVYYSYHNTANVSTVLVGDPSVFQSSVLSSYDNIIQNLAGGVSRSSIRSARATTQFVVVTQIYSLNECTSKPAQYIQKITNVLNSSQINNLLNTNGFSFYQSSGSNLNAINMEVACTPQASTTGSSNGGPVTLPPIVKTNTTAPPLPGDVHPTASPTPSNTSSVNNQQLDLLQSEKTTQSVKQHRDIRLGLGLGLGIGVPFLLAAMVGVYYFATRKTRESYV